jgi:hypothetical protein
VGDGNPQSADRGASGENVRVLRNAIKPVGHGFLGSILADLGRPGRTCRVLQRVTYM